MTISAVVPVWNGRELLAKLLDTVEQQTCKAAELVVVDNGSTDGAPQLAAARGARVIPMGRNAGFAAAVNRGIRESRGDRIAVFNSDVELAPDYLERLSAAGGWFATGKILRRSDQRIDATFDAVSRGGCAWRVGSGRTDDALFSSRRHICSPPWTAVLFRAEVFERVGYLEESFGSYLEDVDFGLRCAAQDLCGTYEPSAVAWHHGSAAFGKWHPEIVRLIARNQLLLVARHYPVRLWWPILVAQLLWGAVAIRHGRLLAWLRGKWQGLRAFRNARRAAGPINSKVLERLLEDEHLIREVQLSTGADTYWQLYFLLTRSEAK
jgi:GT2 family glycosyltransferase